MWYDIHVCCKWNSPRHKLPYFDSKWKLLNGEFRDREKIVRGLKKKNSPLLKGYQLYHNFIRPHMALDGKTPSEKCGIEIEGNNKWITLIQNAQVSTVNTNKIHSQVS